MFDPATTEPKGINVAGPTTREHPPYNPAWEAKYQKTLDYHRTVDIVDPIDVFCMRMRLYGLMPDTHPLVARLVFRPTSPALAWPHGYPAAARDDVEAILATGRARCDDIDLLLLAAFAAFERLIAVRLLDPGIGPDRVDELAAFVLIWLGIPKRQAHARASRALPLAAGQGRPGDLGRS